MFNYYTSCMNVKYIENSGKVLIRNLLKTYISTPLNANWTLEKILGRVLRDFGVGVLVSSDVTPLPYNTSVNKITVGGGIVGTIKKSSMTDEDQPRELVLQEAYRRYMNTTFKLLGIHSSVSDVLQIERIFLTLKYYLNKTGNFTKEMTVAELNEQSHGKFNWTIYFNEVLSAVGKSVVNDTQVLVYSPAKLQLIVRFMAQHSKETITREITWVLVNNMIAALPEDFRNARNKYVSVVSGVETPPARRRLCVDETNKYFEYPIAKLYAERYLSQNARQRVFDLFYEVRKQFSEGLKELEWMDDKTRAGARLKLMKMKESVGYPLFVQDTAKLNKMYENYLVNNTNFFDNKLKVLKARVIDRLKALDNQPDDQRFPAPPVAVNAFYYPLKNKIYVLAGILNKPFYGPEQLKALNYGSIGMIVGHEITHGFDAFGSNYDEKGNLRQWMTEKAKNNFDARSQCLVNVYNSTYVYGRKLDGKMTLSENIADNGGLKYAYRAYMKWRETNGEEAKLPGLDFTNEQLFFIAFGQTWCSKYRSEVIDYNLKYDSHSLNPARVRVPLSNFPQFSKAFNCKAPKHDCVLW
ncbi:membrane metallo-endopeptidase-like 1 [Xenia sp. Carnegie-2017]|uniref:membrane metallo-endopeptidase-like 1 n=1 Tax=Xenia sp. Carnegie-2017 TaxID=2897299 RepID=UPI001F03A3F5|nr:membrane metallo-endopeptidase-like 1 [Xenia sp. Carnegie-2017]